MDRWTDWTIHRATWSQLKKMSAAAAVATTAVADADSANRIESAWSKLEGPLLDAPTEVICGLSKNHQWRLETWWWKKQVDEIIQGKHAWFKAYNTLKKGGKMAGAKEQKLPVLTPSMRQIIPSDWQHWRQRRRSSPQYPQIVMVLPNHQTGGLHKPGYCGWELWTQWC